MFQAQGTDLSETRDVPSLHLPGKEERPEFDRNTRFWSIDSEDFLLSLQLSPGQFTNAIDWEAADGIGMRKATQFSRPLFFRGSDPSVRSGAGPNPR